jgi:hypothetical protein
MDYYIYALPREKRDVLQTKYCHRQQLKTAQPQSNTSVNSITYYFQGDVRVDLVSRAGSSTFSVHTTNTCTSSVNSAAPTGGSDEEHSVFGSTRIHELAGKFNDANKTSRWNESTMVNIFKTTFWLNGLTGKPPLSGQVITHNDVTQFIWRPTDQHHTDFCRYVTTELEREDRFLTVRSHNRKILFICDPQNDFNDNVPALLSVGELELLDGLGPLLTEADKALDITDIKFTMAATVRPTFSIKRWRRAVNKRLVKLKGETQYGILVGLKMKINRDTTKENAIHEITDRKQKVMACGGYYAEVRWIDLVTLTNVHCPGIDQTPNGSRVNGEFRWSWAKCRQAIHGAIPVYVGREPRRQGIIVNLFDANRSIINMGDRKGNKLSEPNFTTDKIQAAILWSCSPNNQDCSLRKITVDYKHNSLGSLAAPGSFADFQRTSSLISQNPGEYDEIYISRDCHRDNHIAHQSFWRGSVKTECNCGPTCLCSSQCRVGAACCYGDQCKCRGKWQLSPYTKIRYVDVMSGKIKTHKKYFQVLLSVVYGLTAVVIVRDIAVLQTHALDYIWELELQHRYIHTVWPRHCMIGDEEYDWRGQYLDISGRDADFTEVNASRGHELACNLHVAIDSWRKHWKKRCVYKTVKTVDFG